MSHRNPGQAQFAVAEHQAIARFEDYRVDAAVPYADAQAPICYQVGWPAEHDTAIADSESR